MKTEIPELKDVMKMIYKQAHICWNKVPTPKPYDLEDLFQEGIVKYYEICGVYDPDKKVKFLSLFTTALMNLYANLVRKASYIRREKLISNNDDPNNSPSLECAGRHGLDWYPSNENTENADKFDGASDGASLLIRLILDPPVRMERMITKGTMHQRQKAYAKILGWDEDRAKKVYDEIKDLIQD